MAELEKVIKGLECVICPNSLCGNCAYFIPNEYDRNTGWCDRDAIYKDALSLLKAQEPYESKYEYHTDHTDCPWYISGEESKCPVTCSQYRDGWNDAMNYIFRNGDGYRPYDRIHKRR